MERVGSERRVRGGSRRGVLCIHGAPPLARKLSSSCLWCTLTPLKHRPRLVSCANSSPLRCQVRASLERHQVATVAHGSLPAVSLCKVKVFCWNLSEGLAGNEICGFGVGERVAARRSFAPT